MANLSGMVREGNTGKQAGYRELGRFGVLVHPEGDMPSSDWDELLRQLEAHAPRLRAMILWSDGTLTPTQRTAITALHQEHPFKIVTFTDSAPTRGTMTALEWFGISVDVFPKAELSLGLVKLGVTADEVLDLRMAIRQLERGLTWRSSSVRQVAASATRASKAPKAKAG